MKKNEAFAWDTMAKASRLLVCAVLVVVSGCRVPEHIPKLMERSVVEVKLVVETDPAGARIYGEELAEMGKAPVTKTWLFEKLSWSNRNTTFRLLPEGTRFEVGEELSIELTVKAVGYKKKIKKVTVPFSGKAETVTRKIVLK